MANRNMAITIRMDGKAEVQRDLKDIETSGDAAFGKLGKSIDQATAAIERQKSKYDDLVQKVRSQQVAAANQTKFNEVLGVNPASGAGSAQASAAAFNSAYAGMAQRAALLRAQIDPLGVAQKRLNAEVADANQLFRQGVITVDEQAAAHALARQRFDATAKALGAVGGKAQVSAYALRNLGFQMNDVISGLAMGQAPLRILAQQGGQIYQVFASEQVGVVGALKAVGGMIGSFLISPLGLATVAAAGFGGVAVAAFSRASEAAKEFGEATEFLGRASGLTREQFDAIAESAAKADSISVNVARGIETAFARTGTVGEESLRSLISLTKEFADKTGANMDQARDALSKAFADPAKSGEKLLASLGGLDDKTAQLITRNVEANDIAKAQQILQEALIKTLKEATDQTTWYGDAWKWVKDQVSGAVENLSKFGSSPALTLQKASLEAELKNARAGIGKTVVTESGPVSIAPRAISDIEATQKAKAAAADAAAVTLSKAAGPLVRSAIEGFGDYDKLKAAQKNIDDLVSSAAALKKVGVSLTDAKTAQDAYNRAVDTYIDPATRANKLHQLEIAALAAKTPEQKRAIAEQREELQLRGKVITAAEANVRIQQAGALAYAQAAKSIEKHTDALRANLAIAEAYLQGSAAGLRAEEQSLENAQALDAQIGKAALNGAKQVAQLRDETSARKNLNDQIAAGSITTEQAADQLRIENALAPLRIAHDLAEGEAKSELARIIAVLTAARVRDNDETRRSRALTELESSNRELDSLRQELEIQTNNSVSRQVELAVLREKQRLLAANISLESDEGRKLVENAAKAEFLKQQIDLANADRGELEGMFDNIASDFSNFIDAGKYDWKSFADVAVSALKDIDSEILKLGALNPLKNLLFGQNNPTLGDGLFGKLLGSVFGSIFGGGGGGSYADAGTVVANVAHDGAIAGYSSRTRRVPRSLFDNAPRLHSGGIAGDEVPAILKRGERVLNLNETRKYGQAGTSGPIQIKTSFEIHVTGTTDKELMQQMHSAIAVAQQEHDRQVLPLLVARLNGDPRLRSM